jgi:hypothetical protein
MRIDRIAQFRFYIGLNKGARGHKPRSGERLSVLQPGMWGMAATTGGFQVPSMIASLGQ